MNILLKRAIDGVVRTGNLMITDPRGDTTSFGDGSGPAVHMHVKTAHAERAITLHPTLAIGDAFMDGELDFIEGDVLSFLKLVHENTGPFGSTDAWARAVEGLRVAFRRLQQVNTASRSPAKRPAPLRSVRPVLRLFLDEDMQYSCAYFEHPDMTLEEAQLAKKRHIAAKLNIKAGHSVLDIGSGWGGLGLYIARNFEADVLGRDAFGGAACCFHRAGARRGTRKPRPFRDAGLSRPERALRPHRLCRHVRACRREPLPHILR